jgi:hypothetical protein
MLVILTTLCCIALCYTVLRLLQVTRLLLQRILNDPVYGVQVHYNSLTVYLR